MGACSSCRFYTAKAEECPSTVVATVVEAVSELEAMTTVGSEGASTSGRSEYYSARCEAMMRSRGQFSDDVALEIEFSKSHWSEVSRAEVVLQSPEEEKLKRDNRKLLKQLSGEYPSLFWDDLDGYVLGPMVAKGGQAEIYEVVGSPGCLMKVFERGTSLRNLKQFCPRAVLNEDVRQCILYAGMLEDGRFAFLMEKCWGDLRKLIDQAMQEKNVNGIQGPPFPYKWRHHLNRTFHAIDFMWGIVLHMRDLHMSGASHRDLKASNILLPTNVLVPINKFSIVVDFECSIGVWGTKFWRALEILLAQEKRETITNKQWKKADVYSYGMTCFEIVTRQIPFDEELENTKAHRQLVIDGKRPQLPSDLDEAMKDLITKCWVSNPKLRPTFFEIVGMVEKIYTRQCQFRLFGIGDELPPKYCLATVEEVNEYPFATAKAMPRQEIANLANGSVNGYSFGMITRLEKRSNIGLKLARLHH